MGAVATGPNGNTLGKSFRGAKSDGHHGERSLLEDLDAADLIGATVYTTLEPCTHAARGLTEVSCCQRLFDAGVSRIVVGSIDPNPQVAHMGTDWLRTQGIDVDVFTRDRLDCEVSRPEFFEQFRQGLDLAKYFPQKKRFMASFDPNSSNHEFPILIPGSQETFRARWHIGDKDRLDIGGRDDLSVAVTTSSIDPISLDPVDTFTFSNEFQQLTPGP